MIPLLTALAGGLGAVVRFLVDRQIAARLRVGMPLGTVLINVTGSLLLGVITGWWMSHSGDPGLRAVLGTGFLGGYTTFSTASVEAARLALDGRGWTTLVHAGGMLVLSLLTALLGVYLGSL
ncbi:MAG TPA: CrcB family protein [Propionicimonas sp.]|nr:CrcB family protein [Propionicimonas sp.]HQA78484.1 CrcB family protein [Propionicimonas sp.]HQD97635.1 CrcB family protein [Propionicimonas sp.]